MIYAARVKETLKGRGKGRVVLVISKIGSAIQTRLETINTSLGEENEIYDLSTLTPITPITPEEIKFMANSLQERTALVEALQRISSDSIPWFPIQNGHIPTAYCKPEDWLPESPDIFTREEA